jgi:hypothetical protein
MTENTGEKQRSPEDIRGWVAELADRLRIAVPDIRIDTTPSAWSMGVVFHPSHHRAVDVSKPARERQLTPSRAAVWHVLTIDPERLASLPTPVQDVVLAYPLVQLALGFQARLRKRNQIARWSVIALGVVSGTAAATRSLLLLGCVAVGVFAVVVAVMTIVHLVTVRGLIYESDNKTAAMLGTDAMMAFIDYRRTNPPDYSEFSWVRRFLARSLPTPDERAKRLSPSRVP